MDAKATALKAKSKQAPTAPPKELTVEQVMRAWACGRTEAEGILQRMNSDEPTCAHGVDVEKH